MLDDDTELKILTGVSDHNRFCIAASLVTLATSKAFTESVIRKHGHLDGP